MKRLILLVIALMFSSTIYAQCKEFALQGNWTVFYRDNVFPTSVLAPDEKINIQYLSDENRYSVNLGDKNWKAWSGEWTHECIKGQTVLIGAIERRNDRAMLVIEISRVIDVVDLLQQPSKEVKLNQINIQFPERHVSNYPAGLLNELNKGGYLASHPGHAHAYD